MGFGAIISPTFGGLGKGLVIHQLSCFGFGVFGALRILTISGAFAEGGCVSTHRLLSSSLLGSPYRILNINHKKELLRSLWVGSI